MDKAIEGLILLDLTVLMNWPTGHITENILWRIYLLAAFIELAIPITDSYIHLWAFHFVIQARWITKLGLDQQPFDYAPGTLP